MKDKSPENEDGKAHGRWVIYHPNGNLHYTGAFINGERVGKWEWWHNTGEYRGHDFWKNGDIEGHSFELWDDGNVRVNEYRIIT